MKSIQLCKTTTAKGQFFYADSKRVSRDAFLALKSGYGKRLDCFVTRATKHAVKDFCTLTLPS